MPKRIQCEMRADCPDPATHIEEKGFVYCSGHAIQRRSDGHRCRKMRPWELRLVETGKPLPSYEPISKTEGLAKLEARCH